MSAEELLAPARAGDLDGFAAQTFSYTAAGELSSDGCASYQYDGFSRLANITQQPNVNCPAPSPGTTTYAYDGLGRQRGRADGTAAPTFFHDDGLGNQVAVESGPGTTPGSTALLVSELDPSGGRHVAAQTAADMTPMTVQYLADDGFGNISTVTGTDGSVACTARFDAFGLPEGALTTTNPCNTGSTVDKYFYRSAREDSSTGQYTFGSRVYDPAKGTFNEPDSYRTAQPDANLGLATDPLTANGYAYAAGDPVNFWDPTGHNPCATEDPGACDPQQNRALAASDRGASNAGGYHSTYHSPKGYNHPAPVQPHAIPSGFNFQQYCGAECSGADDTSALDPSGAGLCDWCGDVFGFIGGVAKGAAVGTFDLAKGAVSLAVQNGKCVVEYGAACPVKAAVSLGASIVQRPGDLFGGLVDWNDFSHGRIGEGIGHLLPSVALTAATGGAAAAARGGEAAAADATSSLSLGTADTWGNPATLGRHFADHGADFGASSADEYASQASQFLQRSQAEGLPTRIDANGVIRTYDPATKEFGAFNANGTTRTYFVPDPAIHGYPTNWDYWLSQPGAEPWTP